MSNTPLSFPVQAGRASASAHPIVCDTGAQESRLYDSLHCLDGRAVLHEDGSQAWCVKDTRHRLNGPDCMHADGFEAYVFVNGKNITHLSAHQKLVHIRAHVQAMAAANRPDVADMATETS